MLPELDAYLFEMSKGASRPDASADAACMNRRRLLVAISDGVADSLFPDLWARLLVNHFCSAEAGSLNQLFVRRDWLQWIRPIQDRWTQATEGRIATKPRHDISRQMFGEGEPARATFAGLQVLPPRGRDTGWRWRAAIVGDSVVFHVRDDELIGSHLLNNPDDFSSWPQNTASKLNAGRTADPVFLEESAQEGDVFLLMTDALAKWLLTQYALGDDTWRSAWGELRALSDWGDFYSFVQAKRKSASYPLDDDDTALIIAELRDKEKVRGDEGGLTSYFAPAPVKIRLEEPSAEYSVHRETVPSHPLTQPDTPRDGGVTEIRVDEALGRLVERNRATIAQLRWLLLFIASLAIVTFVMAAFSLSLGMQQQRTENTAVTTEIVAPTPLVRQDANSLGQAPLPFDAGFLTPASPLVEPLPSPMGGVATLPAPAVDRGGTGVQTDQIGADLAVTGVTVAALFTIILIVAALLILGKSQGVSAKSDTKSGWRD